MRLRTLLLLPLLLVGCTVRTLEPVPQRAEAPPPVVAQPAPEPPKPEPPKPEPPKPEQPKTQGSLTVSAVDVTGQAAPELLYEQQEPFLLVAASSDGRHWLLQKVLDPWYGGVLYLLDRNTGELKEGPDVGGWPREAVWSGRGFYIDWLVHLDLSLQVDTYPALRQAMGLREQDDRLIKASFSADGERVVVAIIDRTVDPFGQASVDLVFANASGIQLQRIPRVAQPMAISGKSGGFVLLRMAPDGSRAVLLSRSPGLALIDTANPRRENWKPLLQPFLPPQPGDEGGPPADILWAPDSRHVWVPAPNAILTTGGEGAGAAGGWLGHFWTPDGKGFLAQGAGDGLYLTHLDGQKTVVTIPARSRPVSFLPDGRLLVARSVIEP